MESALIIALVALAGVLVGAGISWLNTQSLVKAQQDAKKLELDAEQQREQERELRSRRRENLDTLREYIDQRNTWLTQVSVAVQNGDSEQVARVYVELAAHLATHTAHRTTSWMYLPGVLGEAATLLLASESKLLIAALRLDQADFERHETSRRRASATIFRFADEFIVRGPKALEGQRMLDARDSAEPLRERTPPVTTLATADSLVAADDARAGHE